MAGIGHNKSPHQLQTIELDGVPVTIYQRGDLDSPIWHMRIKVPGSTKYVRQSTKTDDLTKAKEIAMERYFEIKLQLKNDIPIFNKSFTDLCKEVITAVETKAANKQTTEKTSSVHKGRIDNYFLPFFGTKPIFHVNQKAIDDYWQWRMKQQIHGKYPASTTLHNEAATLGMVLELAVKQGLIKSHLKPDCKPPVKKIRKRRGALSREEYMKLSRYMTKNLTTDQRANIVYSRSRMYYLVKITVNSGMRPPEIYNLKWADYSKHSDHDGFKYTELNVRGKDKQHTIQCSIRVFNDLEHWKMDSFNTKPDDYIFAGRDGRRLNNLNYTFQRLLIANDIPIVYQGERRSLYSLRHTYATFRLRSGVDVYDLAENMDTGIENIQDHYGHVKGADRAKAVILGHKRFL